MKTIYKGTLHGLTGTCKIDVNGAALETLKLTDTVLEKDILLYQGMFGTYVSFEHHTKLPDYSEAREYIEQSLASSTDPKKRFSSCIYLDYDNMVKSDYVTNREFRELKKSFAKRK